MRLQSNFLTLITFLVVVVGGGLLIGALTMPGEWYASLAKPSFNPPNWIFGPVWTTLYVLIAIAGWRIWHRHRNSAAMKLWGMQLVLNFMWSPLFFAAQQIAVALLVLLLLVLVVFAFTAVSWRLDRPSALMFIPYVAWVAFAGVLNGSLLILN